MYGSSNMGDTLTTRFTHALNTPLNNRCAELTLLIDRCSSKDLQNIFPTLIENIFGTTGGMSWGLRNMTQSSHPSEFIAVHHFLNPLGPIFRLIYKILTETQVKYEYSVTNLPLKVRNMLENTKIPPFYVDLLNIDSQSRRVQSLRLNSFDYYIFHFAYHLINPWQQRVSNVWSMWNTIYYVLSCDYMLHFLPTDPNIVILPRLVHFTGKNPTIIPPPSVKNRPICSSKLFRTHVLQESGTDISTLHQPMQQHPRSEIWRSETIVQIFIDMWLNNDEINTVDTSFNMQFKMNDLPTGEYIRIIRVFVKQLHAFSASGRQDTTPLGELKKIVQPMLQGPMYAFLRHLVYRWPLDGSFRLVLELWLSFIQPWRYLGDNQNKNIDSEIEDPNAPHTKFVDQQYIGFIADNLLAYTVIFQQLLPRFSRIDLISPKNSLMLFRVCKVFGQPNLVTMIREIESSLDTMNSSPTHSYSPISSPILPPLSPTTSWSTNTTYVCPNMSLSSTDYLPMDQTSQSSQTSIVKTSSSDTLSYQSSRVSIQNNKWAAIVRHRMQQWEGPEFCYKPMFVQAAPEVFELLRQIYIAENISKEVVKQRLEERQKEYGNMFSAFFKSIFDGDDNGNDEFSLEERKKVPVFLSASKSSLLEMFRLDPESIDLPDSPMDYSTIENATLLNTTNNSVQATNLDFSPMGSRIRAMNIRYEGDPDLHPIRSTENAFLVRLLYSLSQKLNETHGELFDNLYYRRDIVGKFCQHVLQAPLTIYQYDKRGPGYSPRLRKTLPPRISLRFFASHSCLAFFIITYLLNCYIGYGSVTYIAILVFTWFISVLIKMLLDFKEFFVNDRNTVDDYSYMNDSF